MSVQATSLEAYTDLLYELGEKQQIVLETIQQHPNASNHDLSRILGWEINCVTGRVKELREMGYVLDNGEKKDRLTGRRVMKWISAR